MCENTGSAAKRKAARLDVEDVRAGNVAREQIGRELDPAKRGDPARVVGLFESIAERAREGGLARARVVFEEHVPIGEQRDEHQLDHVVPTSNRRAQASAQPLRNLACAGQGVIDG